MSHHRAFLEDIAASPEDPAPRLIYADWLEDNGEPERAEFIRVQCRLPATDPHDDLWPALRRREEELLAEHQRAWLGPWLDRLLHWRFRGGLVTEVEMEAQAFRQHAQALAASFPLEKVTLRGPGDLPLEDAALEGTGRAADRAGVRGLALDGGRHLNNAGVRAALADRELTPLRVLEVDGVRFPGAANVELAQMVEGVAGPQLKALRLRQTWVGAEGLAALARRGRLDGVRRLDLRTNRLGRQGVTLLAEHPAFAGVEELSLGDDTIRGEALARLAGSPVLGRLRALNVTAVGGHPGESVLGPLFRSQLPGRLRALRLETGNRGFELGQLLAEGPDLGELRHLNLNNNRLEGEGARALAACAALEGLCTLSLSNNQIGDEGLRAVLDSAAADRLRHLSLGANELTDASAEALARSGLLARLHALGLEQNPLTARGIAALLGAEGFQVAHLNLAWSVPSDAGLEAIARGPGLRSVTHLHLGTWWGQPSVQTPTPAGLAALLRSPCLERLTTLSLAARGPWMDLAGVIRVLRQAPPPPRLHTLVLSRIEPEDTPPAEQLRRELGWPCLTRLVLHNRNDGAPGLLPGHLRRRCRLSLFQGEELEVPHS